MDTALALVRHGQTDWNLAGRLQGRTDIELNETGRAQAREVGRRLRGQGWDLVLGSPLSRAAGTAQLIAEVLGAETGEPVPEVIERGFGPLEGRIMTGIPEAEARGLAEQTEARGAVLHRAVPALLRLVEGNPGRRILVVSHGATMPIVRDALAGEPLGTKVGNGEVVPVDTVRLAELVRELDPAIAR
jgi:probable phosphoglycerate mutase